jgi:hypothetical protein
MNPLDWKREHQVALAVAAAIGFVGGLVFADFQPDHLWHRFFHYGQCIPIILGWALLGAAVGGAVAYACRLLKA